MPLLGAGNIRGASSLAPGYYYALSSVLTPPDPTVPANWTPTTKFNDVGVNDHTTWEENTGGATTIYIHGLFVNAVSASANSWTAAIWYLDAGAGTANYWTGAAWAAWGTAGLIPSHGGVGSWENVTSDPTDRNTQFVCLTVTDISLVATNPRIGDFRPLFV